MEAERIPLLRSLLRFALSPFVVAGLALGAGATTYTWTGDGGDGAWETAANWSTDDATTGYPSTTDATIVFGEVGEGTTNTVTITNTALKLASLTLVKGVELTLTNGANVTLSGSVLNNGGRLLLSSNTTFTCSCYTMTNEAYTLVRDATLKTTNTDDSFLWCSSGTPSDTLRFEGTKPSVTVSGFFASKLANAVLNINFDVPKGGYSSAPLRHTKSYAMGTRWSITKPGKAYLNVSASRSVKSTDGTIATVPLVSATYQINTSYITAGDLPSKDSAFTGFTNGTKAIGVSIVLPAPGLILLIR